MELHWVPVHQKTHDFKILILVYKALQNLTPSYISDCLSGCFPNRMLRSSSAGHVTQSVWRNLLFIFTKRVRTRLFKAAYEHNSV